MSRALERAQKKFGSRKATVCYDPVLACQPAALVMLNREYAKVDNTTYHWTKWLDIRKRWFKDQIKLTGCDKFVCSICGKTDLDPWSDSRKNLATIDHIIPVKRAPHLWNEPSNFQVACPNCNQKKGCT